MVSIPNGMEFYFSFSRHRKHCRVSIPNGMEFYNVQLIKILHMCCFNSQRDGILHKFIEKRGLRNFEFQFPTGWNSTLLCSAPFVPLSCFNSQRDGILRSTTSPPAQNMRVSIPNGMEFYSTMRTNNMSNNRFNSQRDGILLVFCWFRCCRCNVSIPNGMEFYWNG